MQVCFDLFYQFFFGDCFTPKVIILQTHEDFVSVRGKWIGTVVVAAGLGDHERYLRVFGDDLPDFRRIARVFLDGNTRREVAAEEYRAFIEGRQELGSQF
ncbi:hypothetical protein D3C86_1887680 [compost metagenome]